VFVIRVENGRGAYNYRSAVRPGERVSGVIPSLNQARPLAEFTRAVKDDLAARLVETGLYAKEARAMVNTWTTSYFQSEGIRALFVLPQSWTDAFIPLTVSPIPKQVVRVMVGRIELLTAERERLAETAVRGLASHDAAERQQAYRFLSGQGRYVEPIVRRVLKTTQNADVRMLCRRLLLTEFVTELRSAVHNAADGKRLNSDPVLLRSHLARLLRDVGLSAEARSEGNAILNALRVHPTDQDQLQAASPGALEIRAAALEAMGDDRTASKIYARRIELQTRTLSENLNPEALARLREWWVGRAYAQCLARRGKANSTIAAMERSLSGSLPNSPRGDDNSVTHVLLAFLLDGQHKPELAESQWSALAGKPKLNAVSSQPILAPKDAVDAGS
jgi:hypothetical protein